MNPSISNRTPRNEGNAMAVCPPPKIHKTLINDNQSYGMLNIATAPIASVGNVRFIAGGMALIITPPHQ